MSNIREKADKWWRELPFEERVKHATEALRGKGQVFRYNNDGLVPLTLSEVVEIYQLHLKDMKHTTGQEKPITIGTIVQDLNQFERSFDFITLDQMRKRLKDVISDIDKIKHNYTNIDIIINELELKILESKDPNNPTKRTGDYRIGLRKAIDILHNLK